MTKNQLDYLGLQETRRNNIVVSTENERTHKANEALIAGANAETHRHQLATEAQAGKELIEQGRHNRETEKNDRTRNLNSLKVASINAEASEKGARIGAKASNTASKRNLQASKYAADKSAQTGKYNADKHFAASKYSADRQLDIANLSNKTQTRIAKLKNTNDRIMNSENNLTKRSIAEFQANNAKAIKQMEIDFQNKKLNKEQKIALKKLKQADKEIKLAQKQFKAKYGDNWAGVNKEDIHRIFGNVFSLGRSAMGLLTQ